MAPELHAELQAAGADLAASVDRMAGHVVSLEDAASRVSELAARYDRFAEEVQDSYASLAGPARELGKLLRELRALVAHQAEGVAGLVGEGGRLADRIAAGELDHGR